MKSHPIAWLLAVCVAVLLVMALNGCAALERPDEEAWQALNAVDVGEKYVLTGEPCLPSKPWQPGKHDSDGAVIAIGAGEAMIHAAVTNWLVENDHPRIQAVWQTFTLGEALGSSVHSISLGFQSGIAQSQGCGYVGAPTVTLEHSSGK